MTVHIASEGTPAQHYIPNACRFALGAVVMTQGAQVAMTDPAWIIPLLIRHSAGDWGACSVKDKIANDEAAREGGQIMSIYNLPNGEQVWVITEPNRQITTILLPITE